MVSRANGSHCLPANLFAVNVFLACVDGVIAGVAFSQLLRIHLRNRLLGLTRQKVFHLMIGCSNIGYAIHFILTLLATCHRWLCCWSSVFGFIVMALPQILFIAAFLLILSFWVDLCHQANDEEEEDSIVEELLPVRSEHKSGSLQSESHNRCFPFHRIHHIGSRQKFVIVVILLILILMVAFAILIWIGKGNNPIDSSIVAQVYLDLFATVILLLGGALACYGALLFFKMSRVRSEKPSEIWKVVGLAGVSIICFTSCSLVAFFTDIPLLYDWHRQYADSIKTSTLMILYYLVGSSLPSAFVLWVMREMPPLMPERVQSSPLTFTQDNSTTSQSPRHWVIATTSQNQSLKISPI